MSDEIKLRYVGNGWLPGVPGRDLTEDEVKTHGGLRELKASGLYADVEQPAAKTPGKVADKTAQKDGE